MKVGVIRAAHSLQKVSAPVGSSLAHLTSGLIVGELTVLGSPVFEEVLCTPERNLLHQNYSVLLSW